MVEQRDGAYQGEEDRELDALAHLLRQDTEVTLMNAGDDRIILRGLHLRAEGGGVVGGQRKEERGGGSAARAPVGGVG